MATAPLALPVAALLITALGIWAVSACGGGDDPGWIVIDEVAGQLVAMLPLIGALSWPWVLAAFLLFRLYDIVKPGPVGWADRRHDAFGVVGDDIIAGVLAALSLIAIRASFIMLGD